MLDAANYSAIEWLVNGLQIEIRALGRRDRSGLLAAVHQSSAQSRYRRFFSAKRDFTEREIAYFLDVNFVDHVALVAVLEKEGRSVIVGGSRYIATQSEKAEMAFAVVDQYQGQGIGAALFRHLSGIARAAGVKELTAEVLANNISMLKVFERSGLRTSIARESDVVRVALQLG